MRDVKKCSLINLYSLLCGMAIVTSAAGCGASADDLALGTVSGKVTHDGQPVNGGIVQFTPGPSTAAKGRAGKPASGNVGADGTFKLSTYGTNDGAVLGKHTVNYSPPVVPIQPRDLSRSVWRNGELFHCSADLCSVSCSGG